MIGDPILMFYLNIAEPDCLRLCQRLPHMFLAGKTESKLSLRLVTRKAEEVAAIVKTGFPMIRQGLHIDDNHQAGVLEMRRLQP